MEADIAHSRSSTQFIGAVVAAAVAPGGGGGYSLIKAIWVCAAPSVRVFARFGLKTGIHVAHFGLESGTVFEGT